MEPDKPTVYFIIFGYNEFMENVTVVKASGDKESFSETKVRESLKRAGAKPAVINKILSSLIGQLHDGISTYDIYQRVFKLFNEYQSGHGFQYSLKQALIALGPSGYPFEKFIAKLLEKIGYVTKTQVTLQGKCISHEIDVVAQKGEEIDLIECKFHNRGGTKSNSKDVLYTQARFEDIQAAFPQKYHGVWLVTNTHLTQNAIKYSLCRGIKLIGWGYPRTDGLEQLINYYQAYPVTCLSFLSQLEIRSLLNANLVLISDFKQKTDNALSQLGLNSASINQIKKLTS